jgi:hypothetical protein
MVVWLRAERQHDKHSNRNLHRPTETQLERHTQLEDLRLKTGRIYSVQVTQNREVLTLAKGQLHRGCRTITVY